MGRTIKDGSVKNYVDDRLTVGNDVSILLDEDAMTSNSATKGATQQSTKAYVDNQREILYAMDDGGSTFNTTTTETTVLSGAISIPAGTIRSTGDRIRGRIIFEQRNNTGGNVNFTHRLKIGGQTLTGFPPYAQGTNGFNPKCLVEFEAVRVSATSLRVYMWEILTSPLNTTVLQQNLANSTITVSDMDANSTAVDFTVEMGTSSGSAEINPAQVMVRVERI